MTTATTSAVEVKPSEPEPVDDKINITHTICKKLVALTCDPTRGQTMEMELRNKLRKLYSEDLLNCIDVLALIASTEESFHDVLAIQKRLESNQTPTF